MMRRESERETRGRSAAVSTRTNAKANTHSNPQIIWPLQSSMGHNLITNLLNVLGCCASQISTIFMYSRAEGKGKKRRGWKGSVPEAIYEPIEPVASCINTRSLPPNPSSARNPSRETPKTYMVFRPGSSFCNPASMIGSFISEIRVSCGVEERGKANVPSGSVSILYRDDDG